jgi:predicted ATPase
MYLKKIVLENLKGFPSLEFDFERPDHSFEGWSVLVGGNASGKSTVLKAVALALMGPDVGRQLIAPAGWVGNQSSKADAKVEIVWDKTDDNFRSGGSLPGRTFEAGVRWTEDTPKANDSKHAVTADFRGIDFRNPKRSLILSAARGPWDPKASGWFATGYGPMRRLSGSSSESIRLSVVGGALSRFVTLFREDAALSESEVWLKLNHSRTLESKGDTGLALLLANVQRLLGEGLLPHGMKLSRLTVDHVYVEDSKGVELPMRDISDGCRSVYATVLDLIHNMSEVYGAENLFATDSEGNTIVNKPGIVLIDEIEAHLHPKWQREIPEWLKTHFPKVQFLVSTHSPLIAQAADPGGVFVLPSHDDQYREPRRLEDHEYALLKLRRAEKTLLGSAFGLHSTRSKWAVDQIAKWQLLSAKEKSGATLSASENDDYRALTEQMKIVFEPSDAVVSLS